MSVFSLLIAEERTKYPAFPPLAQRLYPRGQEGQNEYFLEELSCLRTSLQSVFPVKSKEGLPEA